MNKNAYLILSDGTVFEGTSFGSEGTAMGEVVFTTAMTGHQETLTDSNYHAQIVVQTFPLIGNVGANQYDDAGFNSPVGYVVREHCETPSNFRMEKKLDEFMKERGIVGIKDIDTRRLTRILREKGTMNGMISDTPDADLEKIKAFKFNYELPEGTPPVEFKTENPQLSVALVDFGCNRRVLDMLNAQGMSVTALPWDADFSGYDAVILSNGPGDPNDCPKQVGKIKELLASGVTVAGIGLGHQLLALAHGAEVVKLKHGHRGANIPVKNLANGNVFITSQNHGYTVVSDSITPDIGEITHINVNDRTCEGVRYRNSKAFGFQFVPDSVMGL